MGKKSKKKGGARNKSQQQAGGGGARSTTSGSKKISSTSQQQTTRVVDAGKDTPSISSDRDVLALLESVEERPSKIHGTGVFLKVSTTTDTMQQGTGYKTTSPRLGKVLLPKFQYMNSPMLPPWKDFLLHQEATAAALYNNELLEDHQEVLAGLRQSWRDYVEKEDALANIWIYFEHKIRFPEMIVESFQVHFRQDVAPGGELLRAYGHEWLAVQYENLVGYMVQLLRFVKHQGAGLSAIRVLVNVATLEVLNVHAVDDDEAPVGAFGVGDDLWVASVQDLSDWTAILEYLALTVGKGDPKFDSTWEATLGILKLKFNHAPTKKNYKY